MDTGQPEKYIRTFAGDMETVKKGGMPDLAPLAAERHAAAETPHNAPSLPPPLEDPELVEGPPPSQSSPPPEAPLKTYAGDFSERMKETHASTATILAAEQDFALPVPKIPERAEYSRLPYLIIGVVLVLVGASGAYIAYTRYLSATEPVAIPLTSPSPILVDEREELSGDEEALLEAMEQSVARPAAPAAGATVRLLYMNDTTGAPQNVFAALPLSVPDVLARHMDAEGSAAGIIRIDGRQSPFFILSVSSYGNTFASMLSWEWDMPDALARLFPPFASPPPVSPVAAATFSDITIESHDARAYRDASGREILVYGYWNQSTLIIARDRAAFAELARRLATARPQTR